MTTVGSVQRGLPITIGAFVYKNNMCYYSWKFSVIVSAVIVSIIVIVIVIALIFIGVILHRVKTKNGIYYILIIL